MTSMNEVRIVHPDGYGEIGVTVYESADGFEATIDGTCLQIIKGDETVAFYARGAWLSVALVKKCANIHDCGCHR